MEHGNVSAMTQEIYQFLAESFLRLDMGDQMLMKRFGLTLTQSWALVHLAGPSGRSLTELAHLLMCDKSNVTNIIDRLEEDGLVERKRGKEGDRRYIRAVLTERGEQLRLMILRARERMVCERLKELGAPNLQKLHPALQALAYLLRTQFEKDEEQIFVEQVFDETTTMMPAKEA